MQIAFGRVRRKTSPAIEPAHSPSIAEIASPHAIRVAQSTQRKGSPDSSRQWCMASAIALETSRILESYVCESINVTVLLTDRGMSTFKSNISLHSAHLIHCVNVITR